MGASQSAEVLSEEEDEEEEDNDDDDDDDNDNEESNLMINERGELGNGGNNSNSNSVVVKVKKVLEQEPEMLPCHSSASPLSPQLSTYGTPTSRNRIKVWDPYNVLAPPPTTLNLSDYSELYLICHGESQMSLRTDLIGGRCPDAALTPNGKRQARALSVFFKSNGIRFTSVYTSPLDRSRATALSVCQEMNFCEDEIQSSEALMEMSQGHWEGCHRSEIFTSETITLMDTFQPDFCAPSGESLRQVEFRMMHFLNQTLMGFPQNLTCDFSPPPQHLDFNSHRNHRQGLSRKKSGKSRLQIVTSTSTRTGGQEADDEMSPRVPAAINHASSLPDINIIRPPLPPPPPASCIGIFTHSLPIKCVITGLLGCSAVMTHNICIDDSSVTVLQHSWKSGWQIKKMNETAHLRLL